MATGESLKGKALTVLGPVDPNQLGLVLTHEHLFVNCHLFKEPLPNGQTKDIQSLEMGNIGIVRQHPYSFSENLSLEEKDCALEELKLFKTFGGSTICDVTVRGIRCNERMKHIKSLSESSNVNIVFGAGFYEDKFLTDEDRNMSCDEMRQVIIDEIMAGIPISDDDEGGVVRCGVIGEIASSWPMTTIERRLLQASAQAQQETGAPLIVHPGRNVSSPFDIVDVLRSAGADLSRTVMSHLDRTLFDHKDFLRFAETGCILEFDLFGIECSHYQINRAVDMPSDAQRIDTIRMLCDKGYSDHIVISHDIHTKHRLIKYGGHGYSHIPRNIIPKMRDRGISDEDIEKITVINPRNWLTFI